ncbi:hypothetical protein LJ656_23175 [Paraburkholderia sp. MMS20-SJTR3]|uniref:CdiI immunity protein domain-containing protein n=1 Tax=Paraburkholderia sejongensis TaxID=2886946 RepID=A0ABS8JZZ9_9BURK|nr:contact-dependent growth inhibition system immunity protein [Paraburkholderia sp. MMS20-SJTR3]MCC8395494.1 hypothetical protein [Paraburkholderia sp. MMS20-SJTR3]
MTPSDRYPAMNHLFGTYFGQDFDLFGETVPEIVACYRKHSPHSYADAIREIESFRKQHPDDLEAAFNPFRRGFRPEGWGYTIASFLDEVQRGLNE